jgi:nucleoside-diphosphate-sugar epimerase
VAQILVTGAAGFIGRALCDRLVKCGHAVLGVTRRAAEPVPGCELRSLGDIGSHTHWSEHLAGVDIVVHLANRAHSRVRKGVRSDEVEAASALARAAAKAGVRRLVHMSSVRAMGAATASGAPFRSADMPRPGDAYGRGKLAIERSLQAAARASGLEFVILRPPLVYGPGVKGNFRALIRLVASGLPLPFAGIDNRRSYIFRDNLIDLVAYASVLPLAPGRVLLARDAADLSTPELIRLLAAGLDLPARLFALPASTILLLRRLPTVGAVIARLTESLQVDDSETRAVLGWHPAIPSEMALMETARSFRERS